MTFANRLFSVSSYFQCKNTKIAYNQNKNENAHNEKPVLLCPKIVILR